MVGKGERMMGRYHTVLFDMDGTILDTLDDLTDSVNYTLRQMGFPERTREEVRAYLGYGSRRLIEQALGEATELKTVDEAFRIYRAWYGTHAQIKTKPYGGIADVMRALRARGIRVAVASNKPEATVKTLCEYHFPGLVDAAGGDVEGRRRKPERDMIDAVLAALGAPHDGAVYVGDTEVDVQTAQNADLPVIAVGWGFREKSQQIAAGAAVFADTPGELLGLLTE